MAEQHKYLTFSAPLRLCGRNQLTNLGLYMVLKWAGLRRGRLFPIQIRVAKGVSVYSVVNLPTKEPSRLIRARRIWYNSWCFAVARAMGGALIFDIGGRQTAPATGPKPSRTRAEALLSDTAVPRNSFDDALHIATAAINGMDFLVTWNCKHIANAVTRPIIRKTCERLGYVCPEICTPDEL